MEGDVDLRQPMLLNLLADRCNIVVVKGSGEESCPSTSIDDDNEGSDLWGIDWDNI
jgi:hypothetical protein